MRHHVGQGPKGQVGVHRPGPVSDEEREVHDLPGLAGFHHDAYLGPGAFPNEVVVDGRSGQQGGDGHPFGIDAAIGENEDVVPLAHRPGSPAAERFQGGLQSAASVAPGEVHLQGLGAEVPDRGVPDSGKLGIGQYGALQLEQAGVPGGFVQKILLAADITFYRHHHLFPDGIDGRVGHLGEELLEVVVEQRRLVGENRQRRIRAHGPDRFFAVPGHGSHQQAKIFHGIAEGLLLGQQVFDHRFLLRRGPRQLGKLDPVGFDPLPIGLSGCEVLLELRVVDDAALLGVDQKHPAGLEPALVQDSLLGYFQHAHFGGHHHQVFLGDHVAGGPKSVPVEHRADARPVGKGNGGRTVPGLHETGMVLVESPLVGVHANVLVPGLRDQHHHRVGQRAASLDQELQGVVDGGAVAGRIGHQRENLGKVVPEKIRGERLGTGPHPVAVAAKRVDFSVVGQVTVRMGQLPGGEGVGAEAGVDQTQGALHCRIGQIPIVSRDLGSGQEALVDDGGGRQAGDVEALALIQSPSLHLPLDPFAHHVELALKVGHPLQGGVFPNEDLANDRLRLSSQAADGLAVDGNIPPSQKALPLGLDHLLQDSLQAGTGLDRPRKEDHAHPVFPGRGELQPKGQAVSLQEFMGNLDEGSGPVSGLRIATAGPSMSQIGEHFQPLADDEVAARPVHVDHEADAATVPLEARVVQPLFFRQSVLVHGNRLNLNQARRQMATATPPKPAPADPGTAPRCCLPAKSVG